MRKHFTISVLLFSLSFSQMSCKHNLIGADNNVQPGRRDYTWTVDTLNAGPGNIFYLFSIWGSSPQDVWAAGSGGSADLCLWHYDGTTWKRDLSGPSSDLMSVDGFAQNDVWTCDGGIFRYDGTQWAVSYYCNVSGERLLLNNIWGDAPNNIFAVGGIDILDSSGNYKGAIMRFNGGSWSVVQIPDYRVSFNRIRSETKGSGPYYLSGTRFETFGDTNKIFQLNGTTLKHIYSGEGVATVNEVDGIVYLVYDGKIFRDLNGSLSIWQDLSTSGMTVGLIWGRTEKDVFAQSTKGGVYGLGHFNGTDWVILFQLMTPISDVILFNSDVFVLTNNTIIHGVLNNSEDK